MVKRKLFDSTLKMLWSHRSDITKQQISSFDQISNNIFFRLNIEAVPMKLYYQIKWHIPTRKLPKSKLNTIQEFFAR